MSRKMSRNGNGNLSGRHVLKVISLCIGLTLWWYVLNSEKIEVEVEVPVTFVTPADKAVKNITPAFIKTIIRGSRSFVKGFNQKPPTLVVDLTRPPYRGKNRGKITLSGADISLPFGVEALELEPSSFKIELEKSIKKKVPVRIKTVGKLPDELRLISASVSPKEVMLEGPVSIMRRHGSIETTPVDISSLEGEGSLKGSLRLPDQRLSLVENVAVQIHYAIRPNQANMTLKKLPVIFQTDAKHITSRIRSVSMDVLVNEERRSALTKSNVRIIAELPLGARGKQRVKLRAELPEGVHLLQIYPESINVTVK